MKQLKHSFLISTLVSLLLMACSDYSESKKINSTPIPEGELKEVAKLEVNNSRLALYLEEQNGVRPLMNSRENFYYPSLEEVRIESIIQPLEMPRLPENLIELNSSYTTNNAVSNSNYVLQKGMSWSGKLKVDHTDYYVYGDMKLSGFVWGNGGTIYVMEGGTLDISSLTQLNSKHRIVNFGTLITGINEITIQSDAALKSVNSLTLGNVLLEARSELYCASDIVADQLTNNQSQYIKIECAGNLKVSSILKIGQESSLVCNGVIDAYAIDMNQKAKLEAKGGINITNSFTSSNESHIICEDNLKAYSFSLGYAAQLKCGKGLSISSNLHLAQSGVMQVNEEIVAQNVSFGQMVCLECKTIDTGALYIDHSSVMSVLGNVRVSRVDMKYNSTLNVGGEVASTGELFVEQNATLSSMGKVSASNVTVKGTIQAFGDFVATGNLYVFSKMYCHGTLEAYQIYSDGSNSSITCDKCVTVTHSARCTNASKMNVNSYFFAPRIDIDNQGKLILNAEVLVEADLINLSGWGTKILNESPQHSIVNVKSINVSNQATIEGNVFVEAETKSGNAITDWGRYEVDETIFIKGDECKPSFGVPVEKEYEVVYVASLKGPVDDEESETPIERPSATAISFNGDDAFVTWHVRGEGYGGYIDVLNIRNRRFEATLEDASVDFNHAYIANQHIYVAGGNKKGAFYGEIAYLKDAPATTISMTMQRLSGASGNFVVKDGETVWAISGSAGGVSVFDTEHTDTYRLDEAKSIIKQGNKMLVLAGTDDAKIYPLSYIGGNITLDEAGVYSVGTIPNKDGKNTIAADGDVLYVALGKNGVRAYRNGSMIASYQSTEEKAAANCVITDDQFVYVANGNEGFLALEKETLQLVAKYRKGGSSANFVAKGEDGNIYIAHGTGGVEIIRLQIK